MSFSNHRVTIPSIRNVIDDEAWVVFGNAANRGQLTDESQFQVFLLPALQTILHLSSHRDRISVETGFDIRRAATTSERWDAMAMHSNFRECDAEWSEREKKRKAEKMEEASVKKPKPKRSVSLGMPNLSKPSFKTSPHSHPESKLAQASNPTPTRMTLDAIFHPGPIEFDPTLPYQTLVPLYSPPPSIIHSSVPSTGTSHTSRSNKTGPDKPDIVGALGMYPPRDLAFVAELKVFLWLAQTGLGFAHRECLYQTLSYLHSAQFISGTRFGVAITNTSYQRMVVLDDRTIAIERPDGVEGDDDWTGMTVEQLEEDRDFWKAIPHTLLVPEKDIDPSTATGTTSDTTTTSIPDPDSVSQSAQTGLSASPRLLLRYHDPDLTRFIHFLQAGCRVAATAHRRTPDEINLDVDLQVAADTAYELAEFPLGVQTPLFPGPSAVRLGVDTLNSGRVEHLKSIHEEVHHAAHRSCREKKKRKDANAKKAEDAEKARAKKAEEEANRFADPGSDQEGDGEGGGGTGDDHRMGEDGGKNDGGEKGADDGKDEGDGQDEGGEQGDYIGENEGGGKDEGSGRNESSGNSRECVTEDPGGEYLGEGGRGQDEPFGASGQEVSEPEVKQGKGDQAGSKSAAASVGLMLIASLRLLPPAVGLSPRQH